ncbi:hypothetical protein [Helicobacter sp. TUL]|nr:hypothetical protein [Helicobacter sp. TUL]
MLYTLFLLCLWPITIFVCYKFILLNIKETERRDTESQKII